MSGTELAACKDVRNKQVLTELLSWTSHWGCKNKKDKEPPSLMEFIAKQHSRPHQRLSLVFFNGCELKLPWFGEFC